MDKVKKIAINFEPEKQESSRHKKAGENSEPAGSPEMQEVAKSETPEGAEPKEEAKTEDLEKALQEKEEELKKEHDRLLRALAEFENYKKRVAREKDDLLKFGNEKLLRELLPILDNLELSLDHARGAQNTGTIIEGIEMIKKEFLRKLEKFGLKAISARGEKFDPNKHEATANIETAEHPEDTVVEEFQKGYLLHDRLLRAARVTVARPPKTGK